jgi:hypothetical protein
MLSARLIAIGTNGRTDGHIRRRSARGAGNPKDHFQEGFVYVIAAVRATARHARARARHRMRGNA